MITRIVKMVFREQEIPLFIELFNKTCSKIRSFDGCTHLQLLQSTSDKRIFFTISKWKSVQHLEQYRSSELFNKTWSETKLMFDEKPQAWTAAEIDN